MKDWLLPACGALLCWGIWSFIPKLTTRYLPPQSAIVYEVLGACLFGLVALASLNFRPAVSPIGTPLALVTGMLGFLGAYCFLTAVATGPVTLVATLSALYPLVSSFLAVVFLQEPLTLKQCFGVALALLAMVLITA